MKTWDTIVIGGGIIGLSVAIFLHKRGVKVLVVERGEPGREASHAAAGMLADCPLETPPALQPLATASARMYPEFVHELRDESGVHVDLRDDGAILFGDSESSLSTNRQSLSRSELAKLEPSLADPGTPAIYVSERSVDPRALTAAALKAAKHRGVDIVSGAPVTEVLVSDGRVSGVSTDKTRYGSGGVVNCAGAWAGGIGPLIVPTKPVKGQMLSVIAVPRDLLRHVVRAPDVYLVPRGDGRILIGSTLEDAGFDKRTEPATIQRLYHAAVRLLPALAHARILEDWAGLRPGTPDDLPILGQTRLLGYFAATGHYRNGILLAPVTASVMAEVITGTKPEQDIAAFSPARFGL